MLFVAAAVLRLLLLAAAAALAAATGGLDVSRLACGFAIAAPACAAWGPGGAGCAWVRGLYGVQALGLAPCLASYATAAAVAQAPQPPVGATYVYMNLHLSV
jgi:hypothetical protein